MSGSRDLEYVVQMHEASAERTFPRPSRVQDRYMVGPMHHQRYVGIGYDPLRPPHTIPHDCTTPIVVLADILVLGGAGCLPPPPDSQAKAETGCRMRNAQLISDRR